MIRRYAIGYSIMLFLGMMMVALATCGTPAAAHEDPRQGDKRVIVYDKDHKRIGTIAPNPNGKAFVMRNTDNQITGYIDGGKTYDSDHRRTGTVENDLVGTFWK